MTWFSRREQATLELYGKLPLAKDYLRIGMGSGVGLELRDWLDHAFSGAGETEPPRIARPTRFLLGDDWSDCFQGVVVPSSDVGGLRPFPFVLGIERKRRALLKDVAGGFDQAHSVWEHLRREHDRASSMSDGREVLAALRGTEISISDDPPDRAGGVDLDMWIESLWPEEKRDGLDAALGTLTSLGNGAREHVRLPLVGDLPLRPQVHAWLTILLRIGVIAAEGCPTIFFPLAPRHAEERGQYAFLTIFRGKPIPTNAGWLDAPSPDLATGPGDLCPKAPRLACGERRPVSENAPLLSESIRGPITRFLARSR